MPAALTRGADLDALMRAPGLRFGQSCGYPVTHALEGVVRIVAAPCFAADGCDGATYRSLIVVPASSRARALGDLAGACCAVNARDSHSGMNALRYEVARGGAPAPFFGRVRWTGSHRASLEAVACGEADVAAIDCVTHALLGRVDPALIAGSRVLARSAPATAPPYVTCAWASNETVACIRKALRRAIADRALAAARTALLLDDIVDVDRADYEGVRAMEREALARGHETLA